MKKRKSLTRKIKRLVFLRDDYQCRRCGEKKDLEIHHADENPSNNEIDNLVVLCIVCHRPFHSHLNTRFFHISGMGKEYISYCSNLIGFSSDSEELAQSINSIKEIKRFKINKSKIEECL